MKRCRRCVLPSTKPNLTFDPNGICDACHSADAKRTLIDWDARKREWLDLVAWAKGEALLRGNDYDCIVPVSGGKDSWYQTLTCIEYGLRPLCVSFEPSGPTELGRANLAGLQRYADVIQIKRNVTVYRKLLKLGFVTVGDHEWPNHVGIFTSGPTWAVRMNIPLIVWGENSQLEYGGPNEQSRSSRTLDRRWLEEFGGLLGMRVSDLIDSGIATRTELAPYLYPSADRLEEVGVRGVFLGYYFYWDAGAQVEKIKPMGFTTAKDDLAVAPLGAWWPFENLDCWSTTFHDRLKYLKFGFGRASDQTSLDIRHKRLTREEAMAIVRKRDGQTPEPSRFCELLDIDKKTYYSTCDAFTNWTLFDRNDGLRDDDEPW